MRVLLDENMDRRLKQHFDPDFHVVTVTERGWNGKKNGELLRAAEVEFDALVTMEEVPPPRPGGQSRAAEGPGDRGHAVPLLPGERGRGRSERGAAAQGGRRRGRQAGGRDGG